MQRKISSFFASKSSREDDVSPTEVAESPPPATVSPGPLSSMVPSDSFQPLSNMAVITVKGPIGLS